MRTQRLSQNRFKLRKSLRLRKVERKTMTIGKKIAGGFGLALVFLALIGFLAFGSAFKLMDTNYWVAHTYEVLESLENLLSLMKDTETGQRGFILTRDKQFLKPNDDAIKDMSPATGRIKYLIKDNADQK